MPRILDTLSLLFGVAALIWGGLIVAEFASGIDYDGMTTAVMWAWWFGVEFILLALCLVFYLPWSGPPSGGD